MILLHTIRTLLKPNVTHLTIVLSQVDNDQLYYIYFMFKETRLWVKA